VVNHYKLHINGRGISIILDTISLAYLMSGADYSGLGFHETVPSRYVTGMGVFNLPYHL